MVDIITPKDQQEFSDFDFRIVAVADQSKKVKFALSGLTTNTTTTWTVPNVSAGVIGLDGAGITTVASATSTPIGASQTRDVSITGTTTITSFDTVAAGTYRQGVFTGILTLTYNATSLILPGGANITTAAGDTFGAISLGSGNWRVLWYQRASGQALVAAAAGFTLLGTASTTGASTLTLSGLVLTSYAFLEIVFTGLSPSGNANLTFNGQIIGNSGASGVTAGWIRVNLASGEAVLSSRQVTATVSATVSGFGMASGLSTASTAVTISLSANTFDGSPSMRVYAI